MERTTDEAWKSEAICTAKTRLLHYLCWEKTADDNKQTLEAGWSWLFRSHHLICGAARWARQARGVEGGEVSSCLLVVGGLQVL